ncbi:stage IV sporulation protein FA [Paenibacillus anaericanus]|uniref:M23 family metallopeptidase n=1 Tax=Paenibacillus anaericanus TaxID=170367 RepID=UPI002781162A|nr:M23 family metallopeptidase [Paenibacillus anaericanus]MDQ0090864.1 stage IV sporulation protein FA [Paenibacillus anaericanus]
MDVKSNVKKRREERIKQLTAGDVIGNSLQDRGRGSTVTNNIIPGKSIAYASTSEREEPDPELLWKRGQGRWQDAYGSGPKDTPDNYHSKGSTFWNMFFIRLIISAAIFFSLWGIEKYEPSWSNPLRTFVAQALTREIDFGAVETWYEKNFGGAPSFIPIFKQAEDKGLKVGTARGFVTPLNGSIATPFAINLKGVEITPLENSSSGVGIQNIETGRVLEITQDAFTGKTVAIQHAGGYVSLYGHLEQPFVEKGDWVETGELIGSLSASSGFPSPTLYFALKKDDRFIDPTDVIPFD